MTRVAIVAALPGELRPLVRTWRRESRPGVELWRRRQGEEEWIAACAGIGPEAAVRALAAIEAEGAADRIVSVGWAGALREEIEPGRAYPVSAVVDARTGERFAALAGPGGRRLVTAARMADAAEKRRLAAAYGADLVDMEAAALARLAAGRGVPFGCLKGVSDGCAARLPDFGYFLSAQGRFAAGRFLLYASVRPWTWPSLARLGRDSRRAARAMREEFGTMGR